MIIMKTVNTLILIPVSEKNRNYIINSFNNRISVAEGAVRQVRLLIIVLPLHLRYVLKRIRYI